MEVQIFTATEDEMLTYEELRKNEAIRTYISAADDSLGALGYTEHSFGHVTKHSARNIFSKPSDTVNTISR